MDYIQLDRTLWRRLGEVLAPMERLLVTHCMVEARWADGYEPLHVPGEGRRPLARGERLTSCRQLALETGLSERKVRQMLHDLPGRLPWFRTQLASGWQGRAGSLVAVDAEAAVEWASRGGELSTVFQQKPARGAGHSPSEPERPAPGAAWTGMACRMDRHRVPISVEPKEGKNKTPPTPPADPPHVRPRDHDANDHGPIEGAVLGPDEALWREITGGWPCDEHERTAKATAQRLAANEPTAGLAYAVGVARDQTARRPWPVLAYRLTTRKHLPADRDMAFVRQRRHELERAAIARLPEVVTSMLGGLARPAGVTACAAGPPGTPGRDG